MYDIIGDIHGHASALTALLQKMNYKKVNEVWQHEGRKVIFVGDYIDRGPAIRDTLNIVRTMVENNKAIALMGNHEYNALAYDYKLPDGAFLRPHNDKNIKQHEKTLEQFEPYQEEWQDYLTWFYSLHLFLDLPELRAVHACWDQQDIDWLKDKDLYRMNKELLVSSHKKGSQEYQVINDILKGKEYMIPEEYAWKDKDGHDRTENRIKWWRDPQQSTHGELLFDCPPQLSNKAMSEKLNFISYSKDAPPVFFGHYWLNDSFPVMQASNVICLDYSIAKFGSLVAYRWSGEEKLNSRHFVSVDYKDSELMND
jgi:hypothetical protein